MSYAARKNIEKQVVVEAEGPELEVVVARNDEKQPEVEREPDDDAWLYECSITAD